MISSADTRAIHEAYCRATKLTLKYTTYHHYVFERFLAEGHTQAELELVIAYLWKLVRKGQRTMQTFNFQSLIRDEPRFLDDLAQATAASRMPKVDAEKESVLKSTGRAEQSMAPTAVSAKAVLERPKLAEMLAEWKKTL